MGESIADLKLLSRSEDGLKLKKKAAVQKPMLGKQMSYSLYILEFERMMKLQMRRTDPVRALTSMNDSE